jgi:hypothetical protein
VSSARAIAAVTATLRNLLVTGLAADPDLADVTVTMQPLDRARTNGNTANQVNVFLYHIVPNPTWRNMDVPGRARSGESGFPPLGLNLYYLLTAFGRDNDTQRPFSHHLMGRAMSILNDHPLLGAEEIKTALVNNDLWTQIERVRCTLQPYSVDEIGKLWTGFQTQFRLSVAYEAAVVLIESTRAARVPFPVLMRGPGDSGIEAQGSLQPTVPLLDQLSAPGRQVTVKLGDLVTFSGANLGGGSVKVQLSHLLKRVVPMLVTAEPESTDQQLIVRIPNKPAELPAGLYTIAVVTIREGEPVPIPTDLRLPLAPQITSAMPMRTRRTRGIATVKLTVTPEVVPGQTVSLLLGEREVPADPIDTQTSQLIFTVREIAAGAYALRLRIDGVDSQFIDRTRTPPAFDTTLQVTIT